MKKLTKAIQKDIVERLACYDTPSEIAVAVKDEYGIVITRQAVEEYDPEKRPKLAKKWKDIHATTREAFLKESAREPAAHRAVRVRRLARMAIKAEARGNFPLAKELYEQIAKEVGEAYTNRRILSTGDPLAEIAKLLNLTPEQVMAALSLEDDADV